MKFQFVPELVKTDLEAVNQKEAITSLVTLLRKEGCVQDDYAGLVLEREQQYPTGLQTKGAAIAMPHAFDERIKDSHVAIGILKDAVSFHNMEAVSYTHLDVYKRQGVVTGKKAGTVTITAKAFGKSVTKTIKVVEPSLKVTGSTSLYRGKTTTLKATTSYSTCLLYTSRCV